MTFPAWLEHDRQGHNRPHAQGLACTSTSSSTAENSRLDGGPRLSLSSIDIAPEDAERTLVFLHGFGGKRPPVALPADPLRRPPSGRRPRPPRPRHFRPTRRTLRPRDPARRPRRRAAAAGRPEVVRARRPLLRRRAGGRVRAAPSGRRVAPDPDRRLRELPAGLVLALGAQPAAAPAERRLSLASTDDPGAAAGPQAFLLRDACSVGTAGRSFPAAGRRPWSSAATAIGSSPGRYFEKVAQRDPQAEDVNVGASGSHGHARTPGRRQPRHRAIPWRRPGVAAGAPSGRTDRSACARAPGWPTTTTACRPRSPSLHPARRASCPRPRAAIPGRPAIEFFAGLLMTYRRLEGEANRFAHALLAIGRPPRRSRPAAASQPAADGPVGFFGTLKAGAVAAFATPAVRAGRAAAPDPGFGRRRPGHPAGPRRRRRPRPATRPGCSTSS